jgi:hypothetical protein
MKELVACETVAAIVVHLRLAGDREVSLSGHTTPRPKTLCDAEAAWDTRLPITASTCSICRYKAGL